ncbi:MAG: helix-turn-helix domain-containing protein [Acidobacteriota bacterium]|nr:helix-turn-helix domain-containing protein [Acidobacteriota bacterium]
MDRRTDIRDFLISRRAKLTPEQAGLRPIDGDVRRVPGLRREEVAHLAGVSLDYYTQLERGDLDGASDGVLNAIAHALQLDHAERAHLFDLARPGALLRIPGSEGHIRDSVQRTLDAFTGMALVRNRSWDYLASNKLGRAVYCQIFDGLTGTPNHVRYVFLDQRSRQFFNDWQAVAHDTARILRAEAGLDPNDPGPGQLIEQMLATSTEFHTAWSQHDVRLPASGRHHFNHPQVGALDLVFEAASLRASPDLTLLLATPDPGSTSTEVALQQLASNH